MEFVRQRRLHRARALLSMPGGRLNVTEVAMKCGFLHGGRFSRIYREAYGERPSDALARANASHVND